MKVTYDKVADAMNITFREGRVARTVPLASEINLDLDTRGRPLYLEILGAREKLGTRGTQKVLFQTVGKRR